MSLTRRTLLASATAAVAPWPARADITDATGRTLPIPATVGRVGQPFASYPVFDDLFRNTE